MLRETSDFFVVTAVTMLTSGLGLANWLTLHYPYWSQWADGYFGFLYCGYFERSFSAILFSLIVGLLYGSLIWGLTLTGWNFLARAFVWLSWGCTSCQALSVSIPKFRFNSIRDLHKTVARPQIHYTFALDKVSVPNQNRYNRGDTLLVVGHRHIHVQHTRQESPPICNFPQLS